MTQPAAVRGQLVRHGRGWLPLLGVTALLGALSTLAIPAVLGAAMDAMVAGGDAGRWLRVAAVLIAVAVLTDLVEVLVTTACVAGTTAWLRERLVRHVLGVGPRRAAGFDNGDLVARVSTHAVDAAHVGPSLVTVLTAVLPPLGSLVLLVVIDPLVAVAFVAGVALLAAVLRSFTTRTTGVVLDYQRTQGQIAARLAESLAGARTIAAAGTVERERLRVLRALPRLRAQGTMTWRVLARSSAQAAVAGPLILVAVLAAGGLAMVAGRISPGELFAASRYAMIGAGLGGLTAVLGQLARARGGIRRAAEVLAAEPTEYGQRVLPATGTRGRLEFRAVTATDGDNVLLAGVDLTVPAGATVAVVGACGAGKSVLAELAARLRDPDQGRVLLDGVALDELSHDQLRGAVGCAFARPVLVGETVADAIALGGRPRPQPAQPNQPNGPDDVLAAAHASGAHAFISRLPHGYGTPLASAPFSGGEAQRVGLARAWRAERLLVLDDATSSLDAVTERQISHTLTTDPARRTRLIVTHKATTAAAADLVVWLADGRVAAVGGHRQLWREPRYRQVFG